jgi:hypothetical protein
MDRGERDYRVCDFCGEIVLLEDVFAYADERMLVCRSCSTAEVWSVGAGPSDRRDGGRTRF